MTRGLRLLLLLTLALPGAARAQMESFGGLSARLGVAELAGTCTDLPFLSYGVDARTPGRWGASLTLDGYYRPKVTCAGGGPVLTTWAGETVLPWEGDRSPFRAAVRVRRAVGLAGMRIDLGAGAGVMPATRVGDAGRSERTWHPWLLSTAGLGRPGSRWAAEMEVARHVERSLTYLAVPDQRRVRSWERWGWSYAVTVTFRPGRG